MKVRVSTLGHVVDDDDDNDECSNLHPKLYDLRKELNALAKQSQNVAMNNIHGQIVQLLVRFHAEYKFTGVEQLSLYFWIEVLNLLDMAMYFYLQQPHRGDESGLLLVPLRTILENHGIKSVPYEDQKWGCNNNSDVIDRMECESSLLVILQFLKGFLKCAIHKHVFFSAEIQFALLMSKSDALHTAALQCLYTLALPPVITDLTMGHQQQHGNTQLHALINTTNATNCESAPASEILLGLSKGWSSAGILSEVCVDDVGQRMGELGDDSCTTLSLEFWHLDNSTTDVDEKQKLIQLKVGLEEIEAAFSSSSKPLTTANLYSHCLSLLKSDFGLSYQNIPLRKLAALIHSVRQAISYKTRQNRVETVERRLYALVISICTHPSMDILSGYFMAQPELISELVNIIKLGNATKSQLSTSTNDLGASDGLFESLSGHIYHCGIPFSIRALAMTALTVLITRRNGNDHNSSGGGSLSIVAKQTNVLSELGVEKGRYLGLLPTLIRFSLTSLVSAVEGASVGAIIPKSRNKIQVAEDEDDPNIQMGLLFLEATKPPCPPKHEAEERALEFIDYLHDLTIAVVNVPIGSAALTNCGLIPTVIAVIGSNLGLSTLDGDSDYVRSLRKSVVSQAVQILDTAIVTHGSAFTAFNELNGFDTLLERLHREISQIAGTEGKRKVDASARILLYNLLNCLTVIFHQSDSTSHGNGANNTTVGSTILRSEKLTSAAIEILSHPSEYGALLLALMGTMLSDVMNSDPTVVHHVHSSGIAEAYFKLIQSKTSVIPASPEFIMGVPNMLGALALTSAGADALVSENPFRQFITSIFVSPRYCMPRSKCLLNEMTAIVGTGLDEVMRHVPRVRQLCVESLVFAFKDVVDFGKDIAEREKLLSGRNVSLEDRTHLIQYTHNLCQIISHVLVTADHVIPFVQAGGWNNLLSLYELLIPHEPHQFLSHMSCLSNLSFSAHLGHFGAATALTVACKNILSNVNGGHVTGNVSKLLFDTLLEQLQCSMNDVSSTRKKLEDKDIEMVDTSSDDNDESDFDLYGVLRNVPKAPLHQVTDITFDPLPLSNFLRSVLNTEWLTKMLACILRHFTSSGGDIFNSSNVYSERALQDDLFKSVLEVISAMYSDCLMEASRVRSERGFDELEKNRRQSSGGASESGDYWHPSSYKLRIVCQDGAIVRDGIEIDSCQSVGSLEMGEIVTASDRCVNASGVMRYKLLNDDKASRTDRWISELTRGHGREPITEVIGITGTGINDSLPQKLPLEEDGHRRLNVGITNLSSASASVLARFHGAYKGVLASLSKILLNNRSVTRALWGRSSDNVTVTAQNFAVCRLICKNLDHNFNYSPPVKEDSESCPEKASMEALYTSGVIDLLQGCLYDEKRERKSLNLMLLVGLMQSSGILSESHVNVPEQGFLKGIRIVLTHALKTCSTSNHNNFRRMEIHRSVAGSFIPALTLLHKLTTHQIASNLKSVLQKYDNAAELFPTPVDFVRHFNCILASLCIDLFKDGRLVCLPSHVLHPVLTLAGDMLTHLRASIDTPKGSSQSTTRSSNAASVRETMNVNSVRRISVPPMPLPSGELPDLHRRLVTGLHNLPNIFLSNASRRSDPFEPSEEAITQLMDMGFGRDHAIEALEQCETNQVEVAMEYALTHPPPSPSTVERRRLRREARSAVAARERSRASSRTEAETRADTVAESSTGSSENTEQNPSGNGDEEQDKNETKVEGSTRNNAESKEDQRYEQTKKCHKDLLTEISAVTLSLAKGEYKGFRRSEIDSDFSGQREGESVIVVTSNFVINVLGKSYKDEMPVYIWKLLSALEDNINGGRVIDGLECQFASLCHFTTIILRALPSMRQLVLRKGLCNKMVKVVKLACDEHTLGGEKPWISNALLLLSLLSQPTPSPLDDLIIVENVSFHKIRKGEFERSTGEHKKQAALLSKVAEDMCAIVHSGKIKKKNKSEKKNAKEKDVEAKLPIPTYSSILPPEESEASVQICYKILTKIKNDEYKEDISLNPAIVHSVLLLLVRVLRNHKLALIFLRMGGSELILSLPKSCNFARKTGLVTAIFRHLLEDEHTLRQSMEAEIRSTVARLYKKQQRRGSSSNDDVKINSAPFVQAVAPLICRDPIVFLKAAATSIATEPPVDGSNSGSSIILLSVIERAKTAKALSSYFGISSNSANHGSTSSKNKNTKSAQNSRRQVVSSMSSKRKHSPKICVSEKRKKKAGQKSPKKIKKSDRKEARDSMTKMNFVVLNGSPANHVTSLLLTNMIEINENELKADPYATCKSFISITDYLDILADLVLVVPVCAAAIHRYKALSGSAAQHRLKNLDHALNGCSAPPGTAVGYLLHCLLPMTRKVPKKSVQVAKDKDPELLKQKHRAYFEVQCAQKAARLLVILCARAGEGRRRVVADLAVALRGEFDGKSKERTSMTERDLWALRSWGELCIGISAPRSSGINQDSDTALSWEVVRLMIEFNFPRIILESVRKVDLSLPMASATVTALLRPLEVFTRGSVNDTIEETIRSEAEKEAATQIKTDLKVTDDKNRSVDKNLSRRVTIGPSQRAEGSFADDAMLEDGFMPEDADRSRQSAQMNNMVDDIVDIGGYNDDSEGEIESDDEENEMQDESSDEEEIEVQLGNPDEIVTSESESEDEEEDSIGSNSSNQHSNEESVGAQSDIDMLEDEMVEAVDHLENDIDEDAEEADEDEEEWDDNDEDIDFFDEAPDDAEEGIELTSETDLDWTRIDSGDVHADEGGTGIYLLRQPNGGNDWVRTNNDPMGVLRNILNGSGLGGLNEMHTDALAEIEETLGIRIRNRGGNSRRPNSILRNIALSSEDENLGGIGNLLGGLVNIAASGSSPSTATPNPQGEIGSRPIVSQSDFSLQVISGGGFSRGGQFSAMDYVYGGIADMFVLLTDQTSSHTSIDPPIPNSYDTQLFPLGPAAVTHSRTRQFLHPLLCDINLPPVSAIESTIESQGQRSQNYQRAEISIQPASSNRTNLTVRLNRGPDGIPFIEHTSGGPNIRNSSFNGGDSRWTDDGQPLDVATIGFTEAFERALTQNMATNLANQEQREEQGQEQNNVTEPNRTEEILNNEQSNDSSSAENINNTLTDEGESPQQTNDHGNMADVDANDQPRQDASDPNAEEMISEGEAVASTLAAGLTIASRSDSSVSMEDDNAVASNQNSQGILQQQSEVEVHNFDEPGVTADVEEDHNSNSGNGETEDNSNAGVGDLQEDQNSGGETGENEDMQVDAIEETAGEAIVPDTSENSEVQPNQNGLVCPSGMDPEVFDSLPPEMQRELVDEHRSMANIASQIDASSGLDPEALAALPDEMRREIIAQQQQNRTQRNEPPADPSNAEEMDNASFLASLAPDLRADILLTADNDFLSSLPPSIVAEALVLRDRAASRHQRPSERAVNRPAPASSVSNSAAGQRSDDNNDAGGTSQQGATVSSNATRSNRADRRNRSSHIRVDRNRQNIGCLSSEEKNKEKPFESTRSLATLVNLLYLLNPVRPQRLLQKIFLNISGNPDLRRLLLAILISLLEGDIQTVKAIVDSNDFSKDFPANKLIGTAPEIFEADTNNNGLFRRRNVNLTALSIAANIPSDTRSTTTQSLPPIVSRRIVECLSVLSKNGRNALAILECGIDSEDNEPTKYAKNLNCLIDLLCQSHYTKSSTNLDQILHLLEIVVHSLATIPKANEEEQKILKSNISSAAAMGKEWVRVPRPIIASNHVKALCSVLRLETCKDTSFHRVNQIIRRLCRIEENRISMLKELAYVAQGLGLDATRDLKTLNISLSETVNFQKEHMKLNENDGDTKKSQILPPSAVTLSSSSSELKLLRVLQTVHSLCDDNDESNRKVGSIRATNSIELSSIFKNIDLDSLWEELSSCLKIVSVLQGVTSNEGDDDDNKGEDMLEQEETKDDTEGTSKKLPSGVAGLLTRFLPAIEAFFVVNASQVSFDLQRNKSTEFGKVTGETGAGIECLVKFVGSNKVLLNALIRANSILLEKGLKSMVQLPQCRPFIDFDVKRQWFKTQMRRLRQSASRRYGSLRLNIRRKNVFEDAYYQLHLRTGEEMRGRLHITFSDEEGVDAGGLSREFFEILAKEMFNPNYALFTSTEDGCTFQPNANSSFVNPDHLSHFRFVGRIVGKALADGFLLDAHFTRSLYKHMLGMKPTHHDMEAIDPDFYKNLTMILEYNLEDIGLDHLTFSTDDNSFGRSKIIDLIPDGRSVTVTEENKEKYVSLICQHRMTTSIEPQIKAYLEGFHEMIQKDLISIFNAKELELLISGLPDIDIFDLQKNTEYTHYKVTDKQIAWFWEVMHTLNRSQKASFLQFVTGSAKVPLEGFSQLQGMRGTQKFSITKATGSSSSLMSAHTCFNALELPLYESKDVLRDKLLYAIAEGQGSFQFA